MKALVTGATGFVGQNLTEQLNYLGIDVRFLTRKTIKNADVFKCDFLRDSIPINVFDSIDIVFHLAGYAHDNRKSKKQQQACYKLNTETTIKLAELAAKNNVKKFIYVSSVKAGGTPENGNCADESEQGMPDGYYGQTKRNAEIEILNIGELTGMHVTVIRPALVYGSSVKGNLKLMMKGIQNNWFPPLPDTKNSRTMVYINDLIDAIILASEKPEANGEIFIVTDGEKYSSRNIYNEICLAYGKKIPNWYIPKLIFILFAKIGDVIGKYFNFPFDSNRYQKLLGDDCYSSKKIREKLGYKSKMIFKDALPSMIIELEKSVECS